MKMIATYLQQQGPPTASSKPRHNHSFSSVRRSGVKISLFSSVFLSNNLCELWKWTNIYYKIVAQFFFYTIINFLFFSNLISRFATCYSLVFLYVICFARRSCACFIVKLMPSSLFASWQYHPSLVSYVMVFGQQIFAPKFVKETILEISTISFVYVIDAPFHNVRGCE